MSKNTRKFIKIVHDSTPMLTLFLILGDIAFILLRYRQVISTTVLLIGVIAISICWWSIYGTKFIIERKHIKKLRKWAQQVVDTNYYKGKKITVIRRNGIHFNGPTDSKFSRKFVTQCKEMFAGTGMRIYYNYSWIRL